MGQCGVVAQGKCTEAVEVAAAELLAAVRLCCRNHIGDRAYFFHGCTTRVVVQPAIA